MKGPSPDGSNSQLEREQSFQSGSWVEALGQVARFYGLNFSVESARQFADTFPRDAGAQGVDRLARKFGLRVKIVSPSLDMLSSWRLPVILQLNDNSVGTVVAIDAEHQAAVFFAGDMASGRCCRSIFSWKRPVLQSYHGHRARHRMSGWTPISSRISKTGFAVLQPGI
jgi:hypothetical protein